jgi:hypothetical protein
MATYEGKWRCTFCSAVNRGRDLDCAGCGARRGADVEFFLDDDAAPITDAELLKAAHDGPDWRCETCGGSNRFSSKTCQTCGAPVGNSGFRKIVDGSVDDFREKNKGGESASDAEATAACGSMKSAGHARVDETDWAQAARNAQRRSQWTPSLGLIGTIGGTVLALLLIGLSLDPTSSPIDSGTPIKHEITPQVDPRYSITRDVELVVDGVEWVRTIEMEEYRQVTDVDWEGSVPADARVLSQNQEVHHYDHVWVGSHSVPEYYTERVKTGSHTETEYYTERESDGTESYKCGTRNKGNGFFEDVYCTRPVYRNVQKSRSKSVDDYQTITRTRYKEVDDFKDVPVYRTKVKYSVNRWLPAETVVERGMDITPAWPKVTVNATRRERQRRETYRVLLRDMQGNKNYQREVSAEQFALYAVGAKCPARVNGFDQLLTVTPLPGKEPEDKDIPDAGEAGKKKSSKRRTH